ncbi:uncharacterized protein LOC115454160 [Manduca sexta]|uniref:uncharacterized protein LOC115454160 n=1 Tax=Manduca sexta TaxID=7130 RepID=UPI001890494C|nr:uncharacterized protein LOC115454160 [Manduca sexta]
MSKSLVAIHFVIVISLFVGILCIGEKIRFISTERPTVTYCDHEFIAYYNLTSRRYGRADPFYYVDINFEAKQSFGNNFTVHFYFFESWSTTYRRTMIEMHMKFCDFIEKDLFFGAAARQGRLRGSCPYPAGAYHLSNMSVPIDQIPQSFPIKRGRIYSNLSVTLTGRIILSGYIDMEVKTVRIKKKN